ncbi:hypothetical protein D3C78_581880 [compost metagenome]
MRKYKAYSAGTAPIRNAACQPYLGMMKYAIKAAAIQPAAQKLSSKTTARPLSLAGTDSDTKVEATGSSPPSPNPAINRNINNTVKLVAAADKPLAIENMSKVQSNTARRPNLSAIIPAIAAPNAIPTELILVKSPVCCGVRLHSAARAAAIKEIMPTSIASNIQLSPALNSNFLCFGLAKACPSCVAPMFLAPTL